MEFAVPQRNSVQIVALKGTTAAGSRKHREPVKLLDLPITLLERIARHLLPMTLPRGRNLYTLNPNWKCISHNDDNVLWTSQKLPQSLLNFADASPLLAEACACMLGPRAAWFSPTFDGHLEFLRALRAFSTHINCVNVSFLKSRLSKRYRKKYCNHTQKQDGTGLQSPRTGNLLTSIACTSGLKLRTLDISFMSVNSRDDNLIYAILLAHRNSLQTISISATPSTISAFNRARQYFRLPCLRHINFRMIPKHKTGKADCTNPTQVACELLLSVFCMAGVQSGRTDGIKSLSLDGACNAKLAAVASHVQLAAYLENLQKLAVAYGAYHIHESCEQFISLVCACPNIVELDIYSNVWSQEQIHNVLSGCAYLKRVSLCLTDSPSHRFYFNEDNLLEEIIESDAAFMISAFRGKLHSLSLNRYTSFCVLQNLAVGETLVELNLDVPPRASRLVLRFLKSCRQLVTLSLTLNSYCLDDAYTHTIFGAEGWAKFDLAVSNMECLERLSLRRPAFYTGDSAYDWLSCEENEAKLEALKSIIRNRGRHLRRLWVAMDAGKRSYLESVGAFLSVLQGVSHVCSSKLKDLEVDFSSRQYYFGYLEGDQKVILTRLLLDSEQAIKRIKARTGPFVSIVTGTVLDGLRSMLTSFGDDNSSEDEYFVSFEND